MATKGATTNTRLVLIGAVVLLLGIVLVLLLLRGSIGDDGAATATTAAERDEPEVEPAATPRSEDLVGEGEAETARISLPLELADGQQAVTVRAAFDRAAAALPVAGDRVAVYAVPPAEDLDEEDADEDAETDEAAAQQLLDEVEVLGVLGPRPAANEGTLTVALSVTADDVPGLLETARDEALWLTLLPGDDDADDADDAAASQEEGQ